LQIRRHKFWESLQFIDSSSVSFYIIILDFILILSRTISDELNFVMFVTDKFVKLMIMILDKTTFNVSIWGNLLYDRLMLMNWGLPKVIIIDRDRKFLSEIWKTFFEKLCVHLLYFAAYHSQTNDSFERTNQTIEIALRFYITILVESTDWLKILSQIQVMLNNSTSVIIEQTLNEIAFDFTLNISLNLLHDNDLSKQTIIRNEVKDAIFFVIMNQKIHYDRAYHSLFMKVEEWALIKLHKNYFISSIKSITLKLAQ
jgi:hypothetical protein